MKSCKSFIIVWNVCYVKNESQQYTYMCLIFDYCVHFAFVSCLHVEVLFVCEDFQIAFLYFFFNHVIFYNFLVIMTTLLCCMGFFFSCFLLFLYLVMVLWKSCEQPWTWILETILQWLLNFLFWSLWFCNTMF